MTTTIGRFRKEARCYSYIFLRHVSTSTTRQHITLYSGTLSIEVPFTSLALQPAPCLPTCTISKCRRNSILDLISKFSQWAVNTRQRHPRVARHTIIWVISQLPLIRSCCLPNWYASIQDTVVQKSSRRMHISEGWKIRDVQAHKCPYCVRKKQGAQSPALGGH